jgi:asparagine synthase (glutamine-hydrolysing)
VAARYLPDTIVNRPKHGFAVPIGRLIRDLFRERVQDTLMSRENPVATWFERPMLERLLSEHMTGRANHGKQLWALQVLFQVLGSSARSVAPAELHAMAADA